MASKKKIVLKRSFFFLKVKKSTKSKKLAELFYYFDLVEFQPQTVKMEVDFSTASDKGDKVDKNAGKWIYLISKNPILDI